MSNTPHHLDIDNIAERANINNENIQLHDIESGRALLPPKKTTPIRANSGNPFQHAVDNDDYFRFTKLLSRSSKLQSELFSKLSGTGESVFETLLSSNDYKAAKFISITLKECELWNNRENNIEFHNTANQNQRRLVHFVNKAEAVENFLSYFMFDWFHPDDNQNDRNYLLVLKSQRFYEETGKHLLQKLYEIIDDENCKLYRNICLRIIYQYLHELDQEDESQVAFKEFDEYLQTSQAFLIRDFEYREKVLQILVVFWRGTVDNKLKYEEYKSRIMNEVKSDQRRSFFKLAFLLIEKEGARFEKLFLEQTEHQEKLFGDYFEFAVKSHVRLLSKIVQRQDIQKTIEFIFNKCPFIEVNSTVMSSFYDVQDFRIFNLVPFKSKQLSDYCLILQQKNFDLKTITELIKNYDEKSGMEIKRFLFGRNIENTDSVFERILSTPGSMELIKTIWSKFDLCTREEILRIKNPQGKYLLNYVIESKDDNNLLTFLMPVHSEDPKFTRNKYFLKMLNDQFFEITEKTLYEHHLHICINDVTRERNEEQPFADNFFLVVFSLLEEIGKIQDIRTEVPIDKLLYMAQNEKFYVELLNIDAIEDPENLEAYYKKRYYIDDLLGNIVAHWTNTDTQIYDKYKKKFLKMSLRPFFIMIFYILEDEQELFVNNFLDNLSKLEDGFKERYGEDINVPHYTASSMFVLLIAAMKNDRRQVIDRILKYETFITVGLVFPSNMQSNETSHYVAKKLLEHGYEIGKKEIPSNWIPPKVFKEFLDSRVKYDDEELVEINCDFLLHSHTKKYQIKSKNDVDNKLTFWEDTDSLKYIIESESLKDFLTHPVISTYVELKFRKFKRIYMLNFLLFLAFFIAPIGSLIIVHFLNNSDTLKILSRCICPLSVVYLSAREFLQYRFVDLNFKSYFKKKSNWLEVALIILSITMLITFYVNPEDHNYVLDIFSVLTLLLMTVVLLTMLPFAAMPLHMMMLKTVAMTFVKFFLTFVCILIAFTISFCVIFKSVPDSTQSDDTFGVFKNFHNLTNSFVKVLLMLSGEYSVEPFALAPFYRMIFFIFFVLATFILFNLILGLTIDDVQKLRDDARRLTLKQKTKRFIETSEVCYEVYRYFNLQDSKIKDINFLYRPFVKLLEWLISSHPYLHKLDKFYVNRKTNEITVYVNRKQTSPVNQSMEDEAFDSLKEIIETRNNRMLTIEPPTTKICITSSKNNYLVVSTATE